AYTRESPPFPTRRSSDLPAAGRSAPAERDAHRGAGGRGAPARVRRHRGGPGRGGGPAPDGAGPVAGGLRAPGAARLARGEGAARDRKSTRLNSSHVALPY